MSFERKRREFLGKFTGNPSGRDQFLDKFDKTPRKREEEPERPAEKPADRWKEPSGRYTADRKFAQTAPGLPGAKAYGDPASRISPIVPEFMDDYIGGIKPVDYDRLHDYKVQGDPLERYIGMDTRARNAARSSSIGDTSAMELVLRGDQSSWDQLTPEEIGIYRTLRIKKGEETADRYLEDMKRELNRRQAEQEADDQAQRYASYGPVRKAAMSVASIPTNMVGAGASFAADTISGIKGEEINPYAPTHSARRYTENVRGMTADSLNRATGGWKTPILGMTAGDVYQSMMSVGDMIAGSTVGPKIYGALMGMGAASSEAQRLYEEGATREQVAAGAALAGAAEMFFEKHSLENVLKLPDPKNVLQVVRNGLAQAGFEGSEEVFTEISNILTNVLVMKDKSEWEKLKKETGSGKAAFFQELRNIGKAGVGGFLAGGPTGMVMTAAGYNAKNNLYREHSSELIQQGLESPEGTDSNTLAKQYQEKTESGKELTGAELNKLIDANDAQFALEEEEAGQAAEQEIAAAEAQAEQAGKDAQKEEALRKAYDMASVGLGESYLQGKQFDSLTPEERKQAYQEGRSAAETAAKEGERFNASFENHKPGWRHGHVKGEGVKISDLRKTFNDPQNQSYKILSTIADATGIDIVLYKSGTDEQGNFQGASGKFTHKDNTIYIDLNAGLTNVKSANDLAKYSMMRTFSHEFTHFVEKWNPVEYDGLRKMVFETMTQNGENVHDLIELKQASQEGLSYDGASREVVAESMTDILTDSMFLQRLRQQHKSVFEQLRDKMREYVRELKAYFSKLGSNPSREAAAVKKQVGEALHYAEDVVKAFDKAAIGAVERYQRTVAVDEAVQTVEKEAQKAEEVNKPSEEVKKPKEEVKEEVKKEEPLSSENGFTVSPGTKEGYVEVKFQSKPNQDVIDALKEHKFRWSKVNKLWYGPGEMQGTMEMVDNVFNGAAFLNVDGKAVAKELEDRKKNGSPFVDQVMQDVEAMGAVAENATTTPEPAEKPNAGGTPVKKPILRDLTPKAPAEETFEKKSTKKADWGYGDISWFIPGRKAAIAFSSVSTKDLIETLAELNPNDSVKQLIGRVNYGKEGKDVLAQFTAFGYGDKNAKEFFGKNLRNDPDSEYTYRKQEPAEAPKPAEPVKEVKQVEKNGTPSERVADGILTDYLRAGKKMSAQDLYRLADDAFGGTQAEGKYDRKDAYDAMELAVNKYILETMSDFNGKTAADAQAGIRKMQAVLELLPTQTVRTEEQQQFQQFSTPPNIAYTAAWLADVKPGETVLEPSAGIGGLASFAKAWGANVAVNELSKRRLGVLRSMGFDHVFNENAEQIDNILPDEIRPTAVIMNPPFSSTAGRTKTNKTSNAEKHINQALARLEDGGRLVAILGKGMNNSDYSKYWNQLRKSYNIRANLSIDGENYKKYGTTWGVQIVVIDKTGPQTGDTVTGTFKDILEVPAAMEGIRNDRSAVQRPAAGSSDNRIGEPVSDGRDGQPGAGYQGSTERDSGSPAAEKPAGNQQTGIDSGKQPSGTDQAGKTEKDSGKSKDRGSNRKDRRGGPGAVPGSAGELRAPGSEPQLSPDDLKPEEISDDGVYATFVAPDLPVKGSKRHPAPLVESAAMAAVPMPKATYKPSLPEDVVKNNLSDAQMVSVTYAGQAHQKTLPDGSRRGFFIGDGTGVGKGRQIAGIILDNFMQGRNKAVWISKNADLYGDAIRDWTATTGRSKDEVMNQSKVKAKDKITAKEGILYSTYDTLKSTKGGNRMDQIVDWLGKDFDGVIAFDEAHNMGNLFGKVGKFGKGKGSEKARAGVELQRRLPNARIVYVSATGATEVENLAYAERLGLWGTGTSFSDAKDFVSKIGASGLSAMELVVRDLKSMGSYVARSISYNGVNYDTVEHPLTEMQTEIYNTMSRAWQKTMQNANEALQLTGGDKNSRARQMAIGQYYSAMQRFYNQVLTSMSMPSVIEDMRKELDAGHSIVVQMVNTLEAQQNRQLADAKANGIDLDDLDMTPREALLGYVKNSFPVQMYEEYLDDDGNMQTRPVVDSKGNPVLDKRAVRQRDELIEEINQMSIPEGPLEMLFDAFGTEMVAENTGRTRRVVPKKMADGTIKKVEESRSLLKRTADVQAFQDGTKRILVFSDAGGTGKSYHADRNAKNQQPRIHYVLQPGWVASNAVQGFGRSHRSNEASAPAYKLVTTNIKGQKRFTSTIARRLDQLGALTKGQRDTGSGMFGAKDNLETDLARDSLREFYTRLGKNQIEGLNGMAVLDKLGLKKKFTDENGNFKVNDNLSRDMSTFLNRILALEVEEQNTVFDAFTGIYEMELEQAIQAGTLDTGMENVKADKIEILDDKIIRQDEENDGAATHYVQAKTYKKPKIRTTIDEMANLRNGFIGMYRTEKGDVRAVYRVADKTTSWGEVQKQYRLFGPNAGKAGNLWNEKTLAQKAKEIPKAEWQKAWDEEIKKVPEYNEETVHMLTGTLLPIWDYLPNEEHTKVQRLIANDGSIYLGRIIANDQIDTVLRTFDVNRTRETFDAKKLMDKALKDGTKFTLLHERAQIFRSRVSGEWRLELVQDNSWFIKRKYPNIIQERIGYRDRYFIPTGESGMETLEKILEYNPVKYTSEEEDEGGVQYQQRTETLSDREVLERAANTLASDTLTNAERDALGIFQDRLAKLEELEGRRQDLGTQYRELQFGANGVKVDRKAAEEVRSKMLAMDGHIQKANEAVLSVEDKQVLKRVLQKARRVVTLEERDRGNQKLARYRDRRNNSAAAKKYRDRVIKDVKDMQEWVMHPDNKNAVKHIPDALKTSVLPFLSSIDMTSKRALRGGDATKADAEFQKRLEAMQTALANARSTDELYSGFLDLPVDFQDNLNSLAATVTELVKDQPEAFVINKMTAAELKNLSEVVRAVKVLVQKCNRLHSNGMFQHVYDAGNSSIRSMGSMYNAPKMSSAGNAVNQFLFWQQIRPAYAFERFGDGGKAIWKGLQNGQAQLAKDAKTIIDFTDEAYSEDEIKSWEKETVEFNLTNGTIRMPVTHIMSLYELSKRPHALNHIISEAGGIRVATYKDGKKVASDQGHLITEDDVNEIIETLTPRQMAVADALQQYMANVGGKWRNEINFVRFGEEAPIDPHYFPISSDGQHLESTVDQNPTAASLYALLNMSFNKPLTEGANNRIILYSIFDVFSNHMTGMAQYHSMALPVLDALKWFNYRQTEKVERTLPNGTVKTETKTIDSVRDEMSRVYGKPEEKKGSGTKGYAEQFVINILRGFNGTEAQGTPMDSRGLKHLHKYNRAQVAFNVRSVIQQPFAVTRAGMLMGYDSIMKGMSLSPEKVRQNIEEMNRYSGIALWKSMGFYDVNISRGLTSLIKHDEGNVQKLIDFGLKGAEKADELTWAAMWNAAKIETQKKKGLNPGDEGFYEAVSDLFEEVIYKTQVVDSILTKNEFMRDKGFFARTIGSFMSEPTTTASMLMDAYEKFQTDIQRGYSQQQAWERNKSNIGRTAYVYGLGAVVLAAAQAIADAWRDDDDYETFLEKWLNAFTGNALDELSPFNKVPIVSDFYDAFKEMLSVWTGLDVYGNPPQSVIMQWYSALSKGSKIIHDKVTGKKTNYTWYGGIYKMLQAVSGAAGLPIAALTREIVTGWNNTVGHILPNLKVKSYDPGDKNSIKYAYKDGYLTDEEATGELLKKGLAESEDDAYWMLKEWRDPDGAYTDFDDLYNAIRSGTGVEEAKKELMDHGYTEKEIRSRSRSAIGTWYQEKEITREQAIKFRMEYGGDSKEDAKEYVQYLDLKTAYPDMDITQGFASQYFSVAKPARISIEVYADFYDKLSGLEADKDRSGESISGSKKKKVLRLIQSMPLNKRQKDALYIGAGYAKSAISEAPWH